MHKRNAVTAEERFWTHVVRGEGDACWEWSGYRLPAGYGTVHVRPRKVLTHRYAWEITFGPIPPGQEVCHTCDNPPCVRPDHLFLGTPLDNRTDMVTKGRAAVGALNGSRTRPERLPRGTGHWASKLTEADVLAIRARHAAGATGVELAADYGVGRTTISHVVNRLVWRHV